MELLYKSKKVELQCNDTKAAGKLFGGDKSLVISLQARVTMLKAAKNIKDITCQKALRFHNLNGKDLKGFFAIDVKSIRNPWRIILQPLDENGNPFNPCHIDEIADKIKFIKIMEVSKHYE